MVHISACVARYKIFLQLMWKRSIKVGPEYWGYVADTLLIKIPQFMEKSSAKLPMWIKLAVVKLENPSCLYVFVSSVTNPEVHMLDLIQINFRDGQQIFFSKDLPSALITILLIPICLASLKWIGSLSMVHKWPEFSWPREESSLEWDIHQ